MTIDDLPAEPPAMIRARLLGPVEIVAGGRLLTSHDWSGRKARSLLVLLLATRDHRLHREQALDLLWPELDQRARVTVIRDGPQDLPERHQTLQNLVTWSYDLLREPEQALFRRLAVFAGGVELDALAAVGGEDAVARANVLVDMSLAHWIHVDGARRLAMLETIREMSTLLLAESGDEAAAWDTTIAFHVSLSARAYQELHGPAQLRWYDRLQRDLDTIRVTLERSLARDPEAALAISGHLGPFWYYRQHTLEGLRWLEQALGSTPEQPTHNRLVAAIGAAQCLERSGDYEASRHYAAFARDAAIALDDPLEYARALRISATQAFRDRDDDAMHLISEALELSRHHGDAHGVGHCLVRCALDKKARHDFAGAIHDLEEALGVARQSGNQMVESYVLMHLANTVYQSVDLARAASVARECERAARIANNRLSLPWSLILQMLVAHEEERFGEALLLAREAATLFAEVGDRRGDAAARIQCGMLEACLGNHDQAAGTILSAIPDVRRYGYESDKHDSLMETALLAGATGQPAEALTLMSANDAHRDSRRSPGDQARFDGAVAAVREKLDAAHAKRAWEQGAAMSLDDALDLAEGMCRRTATSVESVA